MPAKKVLFFLLFVFLVLSGCTSKKKKVSLSGDDPVEVSDFISFFMEVGLPLQITDSIWNKKDKDSLLISYKVFSQFVPDSIFNKTFGKDTKLKIYPIGRKTGPGDEIYLFAKLLSSNKKAVYVLGFDKKQNYMTAITILPPANSTLMQSLTMDRKYTLIKSTIRKNKDGSMSEGKDVYALNPEAREFQLVMTDALDDKMTELINPIDTLSRKNKYAADYTNGKLNLVSIRDGRKSGRVNFFIHFDKNNGDCTGELKGEALFTSSNTAEYIKDGDPCKLKFIFSSSSVTLKEIAGCGSRRGLKCSFDGSFPKRKEAKPKKK